MLLLVVFDNAKKLILKLITTQQAKKAVSDKLYLIMQRN